MDQAEIEAKVIEIVAKQTSAPKEKVTKAAKFTDDLGADSLEITEMIMELEDAFGISIPDEDLKNKKIQTVGDVIEYIGKVKT